MSDPTDPKSVPMDPYFRDQLAEENSEQLRVARRVSVRLRMERLKLLVLERRRDLATAEENLREAEREFNET
jgi:hypothetical protein